MLEAFLLSYLFSLLLFIRYKSYHYNYPYNFFYMKTLFSHTEKGMNLRLIPRSSVLISLKTDLVIGYYDFAGFFTKLVGQCQPF